MQERGHLIYNLSNIDIRHIITPDFETRLSSEPGDIIGFTDSTGHQPFPSMHDIISIRYIIPNISRRDEDRTKPSTELGP